MICSKNKRAVGVVRGCFTMVELLMSMVVILLMAGIAISVFGTTTTREAVNATARKVSTQLHISRQYAVSKRTHVALLFPSGEVPSSLNKYADRSFRPCIVSADGAGVFTFQSFIKGTEWAWVDKGVKIDTTSAANLVTLTNTNPVPIQLDSGTTVGVTGMKCVVFKPTGMLTTAQDVGPIDITNDSGDHKYIVTINWLTGKAEFYHQQ